MPKDTMTVYRDTGAVIQPVVEERPTRRPAGCGSVNEDLECLGCGEKMGCVIPGHCYAVEGEAAKK